MLTVRGSMTSEEIAYYWYADEADIRKHTSLIIMCLDKFRIQHNFHPITTMKCRTPPFTITITLTVLVIFILMRNKLHNMHIVTEYLRGSPKELRHIKELLIH